MLWHPYAELEGHEADRDAGYFIGSPYKFVLHSTEGDSIAGAESAYDRHDSWPHLTANPKTQELVQHISFGRAARALENDSGGVQTNKCNAIQLEIVGYADAMGALSPSELLWLGHFVLAPVLDAFAIPRVAPKFVGREAGYIAREDAPQRFTFSQWEQFNGVCGHQHVPENAHWDPGAIDINRLLAYTLQEDDLTPEQDALLRQAAADSRASNEELKKLAVVVRDPTAGIGKRVAELWAKLVRDA